jgi:hypothetical protein
MNLIELALASSKLVDKIIESGGETTQEIEEALCQLDLTTSIKIDAYSSIIDKLENQSEFWKQQEEQCKKARKACESAADRLRENIKTYMLVQNRNEARGNLTRFVLSEHKPKLVIEQLILPPEYMSEVKTYVPDKEIILSKLEHGETISGARLEAVYCLRKYLNRG